MLKIGKSLIVVFAVVVLFVAYFLTQVDWDARAIRRQFSDLVELVEKDGPVSTLESIGRSRKLHGFFTQKPSLEYYPNRSLPGDLDALSGAFISVWGQVDAVSVTTLRHQVFVDGNRAESQLTARCSVRFQGAERMGDTMKYRLAWMKIEDDWRIEQIECVEASR